MEISKSGSVQTTTSPDTPSAAAASSSSRQEPLAAEWGGHCHTAHPLLQPPGMPQASHQFGNDSVFVGRRMAATNWKILDVQMPWAVKFLTPVDDNSSTEGGETSPSYAAILSDFRYCWGCLANSSLAEARSKEFNADISQFLSTTRQMRILTELLCNTRVAVTYEIEVYRGPNSDEASTAAVTSSNRASDLTMRPQATTVGCQFALLRLRHKFGGMFRFNWNFKLFRLQQIEDNILRTQLYSPMLCIIPALQTVIRDFPQLSAAAAAAEDDSKYAGGVNNVSTPRRMHKIEAAERTVRDAQQLDNSIAPSKVPHMWRTIGLKCGLNKSVANDESMLRRTKEVENDHTGGEDTTDSNSASHSEVAERYFGTANSKNVAAWSDLTRYLMGIQTLALTRQGNSSQSCRDNEDTEINDDSLLLKLSLGIDSSIADSRSDTNLESGNYLCCETRGSIAEIESQLNGPIRTPLQVKVTPKRAARSGALRGGAMLLHLAASQEVKTLDEVERQETVESSEVQSSQTGNDDHRTQQMISSPAEAQHPHRQPATPTTPRSKKKPKTRKDCSKREII